MNEFGHLSPKPTRPLGALRFVNCVLNRALLAVLLTQQGIGNI